MMDFRQRLEQSRLTPVSSESPVEPGEHFSSPFFGTDRTRNPICLDFRLKGGARKAVPYAFITEISYDVDNGIEITTTGKSIRVIGRNLTALFEQLLGYRVRYIQTNIGNDADEDGLFVKEIVFVEMD
jgi:hypothetical protein